MTISRIAGGTPLACAAFDRPLGSDLKPIGIYRIAERMLTRRLQRLIGKPGQSSTPVGKQINCHANEFAKSVLGYGKYHPLGINRDSRKLLLRRFLVRFLV